jgi:hypothetical protein
LKPPYHSLGLALIALQAGLHSLVDLGERLSLLLFAQQRREHFENVLRDRPSDVVA